MKKRQLLGTTAMIAGTVVATDYPVAEEHPRIDIRDFRNESLAAGNHHNDGVGHNNMDHFGNGELQFCGARPLDSMLVYAFGQSRMRLYLW